MEDSLVEQPQLKGPPSAEQSLTEQPPKTQPSVLLQHSDGGRLQAPLKEPSLEKNVMDYPPPQNHHSKHSPIQHHHKEPSIERNPQSEQPHNKPPEGSSASNPSSQLDHSKTSPSKEHYKEASSEKILMETPLAHHHTKPSPTQESRNETCIEKNVVETLSEQHHTKPAIVQEDHKEKNPMDTPSEHHHNKPLPTHEHHKEPLLENKMDSVTQQQHAKPSLTHDHHMEDTMEKISVEHHPVESLLETRKLNSSAEILQADSSKKADQKDHTVERFSVDLSTEGKPVKSLTPPQQSVSPAVSLQHQEQHRKVVQETTCEADLSSQQLQINPMIEQHQVNVPNEHKQVRQRSEHEPMDLFTEQILSVSSQHSTDVATGHHLKPSVEQNQVESPREQPCSEPSVKEHLVEPVIEHTGSSALSQQEANEGPFGVSTMENPHLETTRQAEVHGNFTEEPTSKQPQIFNLRSQKPTRAEIDTAAPFESVKAAVSLFGERMDWKSQLRNPQMQAGSSTERRTLPEPELHKAQEDLVYYKDKLALTQASTAGVLLELKKVKKLIQNPASKQEGTDILSHKSMEAADASKSTGEAFMNKPANLELQSILREVEIVKEDLISATVSKEAAVKGLQDALSSLNAVLKRVDELGGEKASLDEAVADAHIALADAEEQVALLRSGHKVDSINSVPSDLMEKKSAEIKGLESKLEETTAMIMKLKQELLVSKQAESVAVAAATETQQKMAKVQIELEQAKSEELSMVGKLAKILEESDELKTKLEKATQERDTLSSTMQSLKADLERGHMELDSMHEKEQIACATLASLQDELQKVKEALQSARAGEAKALEAKDTLPASIKQAASEADEAKAAAEASKEEARKARQEIEQAKAATSTALSRQQAALKELEAAKASEAMASADLKALKESETQGADMESELEGVMGVTVSLEEYSALKQAAVEAEGLADKKVAEAIAHVEEAKSSQSRAQSKLDDASKEAERCRDELQRTQKQADDAQEAKLTVEADFRKWRAEHDQRRKSGGAPLDLKTGSTQSSPRKLSSDEKVVQPVSQEKQGMVPPFVQRKKVAGKDSLAQIMSLQVPTPERHAVEDSMKDNEKVKKKNFIRRIASIVALKRKP